MAIFKVTYIFELCDQVKMLGANQQVCAVGTWSETWWRNFQSAGGVDVTDIETALYMAQRGAFPPAGGTGVGGVIGLGAAGGGVADPDDYLFRRLPFLPSTYTCTWVRVSTVPLPPFRSLSKVAPVGRGGGNNTASAQVTCTIPTLFTAIVGAPGAQHSHRRKFHLHGVPTIQINGNAFAPDGAYMGQLTNFLNLLTRRAVAGGPGVTPWRLQYSTGAFSPVGAIVINPPGVTFNIPNPGDALAVGARVQIKGTTRGSGFNRTWTVIARDTTAHSATLGIARRPLTDPGAVGVFRLSTPAYAPPTNVVVSPIMGSRRVSNRPFRLVPGRSRRGR